MSDDAVELELMIAVDTENGVGIWTNEVECKGAIWSCECKFENNQLIAYVHCNKRNEEISGLDVWKYTAKHHFICRGESGAIFTLVPITGIKEYFSHDNEVTLVICFREELEALDYDDDSQEQLCTIVAHIKDIKNISVMSDRIALKLLIPADTVNGTGIWTEEVECQGAKWSCEYKFENDNLVCYVNCNTRHAEMPAWEYTAQHQFHIGFSKKSLSVNKYIGQLGSYFKNVNGEPVSANAYTACSREELLHFADNEGRCKLVVHIFDIKNHLRGNVLIPGDFILMRTQENLLGRGADASVYKGEYKEVPVAIKEFHVQKTGSKDPYTEELERFIQLRHQNLVKMIGHVPKRRFIVLELCQNGSLHKHIHDPKLEIDWQRLNSWIKHIIEGMIYLHRNDVTHRDLKSDNILIGNDWVLQITDFARAKTGIISEMSAVTSRVGTVGYMAPELLSKGDDGRNTRKIDVWSFGVILWELFTRYRPYAGLLETEIFLRTADRELKLPELPTALPVEIRSLINRCLSFEPKDRPSFEEIKEKLWKDASYAIEENHENWTEIAEECHKFAKSYHYAPRSIRTASNNTMSVEGSVKTLKLSDTPDLNAEEVAGTSQENNVANDTPADQNVVVQKVHAPSNAAPMAPIATRLVVRKPWDW